MSILRDVDYRLSSRLFERGSPQDEPVASQPKPQKNTEMRVACARFVRLIYAWGKTKRDQLTTYIDPTSSDIPGLVVRMQISRHFLSREAIDDLLKKHGALKNLNDKP